MDARKEAEKLSVKAGHYSSAFRHAATICSNRARVTDTPEVKETLNRMADLFREKSNLEQDLKDRLDVDPVGTMRDVAEGLW